MAVIQGAEENAGMRAGKGRRLLRRAGLRPGVRLSGRALRRLRAARRGSLARAVLTGRIGRPRITLQGDLDDLLPKATESDVYARMVAASGRGPLHRYYTIQRGTHVDGLYNIYRDRLRPILRCYRSAFVTLASRVERGARPPADHTVARPADGDVVDSCPSADRAAPAR